MIIYCLREEQDGAPMVAKDNEENIQIDRRAQGREKGKWYENRKKRKEERRGNRVRRRNTIDNECPLYLSFLIHIPSRAEHLSRNHRMRLEKR